MDTQTMVSLRSAIEHDRQIVQAEKAAEAAQMEEQQDRFRLSSHQLQMVLALGLVITVLASVIAG